jgi:cellulose biosynthesis protein BcsQ
MRVPGFAYRDFVAPSAPAPVRTRDRREGLATIAFVSLVPEVGRTTICANLRDALARAGARVGAVDLDPRGALTDAYGADGREPAACIEQLASERDLLLLDSGSPPPDDLLVEADDVIVVARADPRSFHAVGPMEELLVRTRMRSWRRSRARWLVNGFDARRRSDREHLRALRRALGGRVLQTVIQEDRALRSAFAARKLVREMAPASQAVRDFQSLARELFAPKRSAERDAHLG